MRTRPIASIKTNHFWLEFPLLDEPAEFAPVPLLEEPVPRLDLPLPDEPLVPAPVAPVLAPVS